MKENNKSKYYTGMQIRQQCNKVTNAKLGEEKSDKENSEPTLKATFPTFIKALSI
jgi:hypothetical protein